MSAQSLEPTPSDANNAAAAADEGGDWAEAPKRRRQAEKPKFVVCLDQARRGRPVRRALVMATRPQAEPLFPGCSDTESSESDTECRAAGGGARDPKFVLGDVQCLLSYALLTHRFLHSPRWCHLAKPNCVPRLLLVVVDSAPPAAASRLPMFLGHYYQAMRLLSPYSCGDTIGRVLFGLPLQSVARSERQLLEEHLTPVTAKAATEKAVDARSPPTPIGILAEPPEKPAAFPERDKFPRTELLLSSVQLLYENYPLPGLRSGSSRSAGYRTSLPAFQPATPDSPLFGLDCEMVVTEGGPGGTQLLELARVTLVDESHRVLLDQLVKPPNPVLNYITAKSGITREMLDGATTTLEDVQEQLATLLPQDAILVGHSLNCDLHALKICHPSCIDTSVVFNLSGSRRHKASLKALAQRFLGRDIQSSETAGHSSAEDALAALELVQLKLTRSLEFGDAACGSWNPAAPDSDSGAPAAKRPRYEPPDAGASASGGVGGFHASLNGGGPCGPVSLFDWLRLRGVSFRVFDRRPQAPALCPAARLPAAYLVRDLPNDAAVVEAAIAEIKCSRFVALRLRCLEEAAEGADALAALDGPLERLHDALPQHSLSIVLLPGRPDCAGGSAKCYFNMKGMTKPQAWAQKL